MNYNEDDDTESGFFDHFKIIDKLGQGAFAEVVAAVNKKTGEEVAVKVRCSP